MYLKNPQLSTDIKTDEAEVTISNDKVKKRWYLSLPAIFVSMFLMYPLSIVLSIIRVVKQKRLDQHYRRNGWIALGVHIVLVAALIFAVGSSTRWEKQFDDYLASKDYEAANTLLDEKYAVIIDAYGINAYFRVFNASGDYSEAEEVLIKYYDSLSDKTTFSESVKSQYEEIIPLLSVETSERIQAIFDQVDHELQIKEEKEKKAAEEAAAKAEKKAAEEAAAKAEKKAAEEAAAKAEKKAAEEAAAEKKKASAETKKKAEEAEKQEVKEAVDNYLEKQNAKNLRKIKKQRQQLVSAYIIDLALDYSSKKVNNKYDARSLCTDIEKLNNLHVEAFGESLSEIIQLHTTAAMLSDEYEKLDKIVSKYPFSLANAGDCIWREFYISQRLETAYSDNLLGMLQKEIESYKPELTSEWVAYNLEYTEYLGSYPGDEVMVICSDQLNPFTAAGEYDILCYYTTATKSLKDENGFVFTVPVVYMISDEAKLWEDYDAYTEMNAKINLLLMQLSGKNLKEGENRAELYLTDLINLTTGEVMTLLNSEAVLSDNLSGGCFFYFSELPGVRFGYVPYDWNNISIEGDEKLSTILAGEGTKISASFSADMTLLELEETVLKVIDTVDFSSGSYYNEMTDEEIFEYYIETNNARITYLWYVDRGASLDGPASEVSVSPR